MDASPVVSSVWADFNGSHRDEELKADGGDASQRYPSTVVLDTDGRRRNPAVVPPAVAGKLGDDGYTALVSMRNLKNGCFCD